MNSERIPPVAERRPQASTHHEQQRTDDYAWLRAENWQQVMREPQALAADIRAYLEAENDYAAAAMEKTSALQNELFLEMKGRVKEDDSTVPSPDGEWAYFRSYVTGGQHPLFCREPRAGGERQILLDGNRLAEGLAYFDIGGVSHSPDHRLLAYSTDERGSEYYTLKLRDIGSGAELPDLIPDTGGYPVWSADGQWFFYARLDDNHRPRRIYRHKLGTPADEDVLVYEEPDIGFSVQLGETSSRRFILLQTGDHQTSEVRLIDAANVEAEPILIAAREAGHEYSVEHHGDRLIITTNSGGAEDFRIVEAPANAPGRENWREIEPHRQGRLIIDVLVFKDWLVRLEREQGLPRIVIRRWAGAFHRLRRGSLLARRGAGL
jgi:oligopeptidase B